MSAPNRLGDLLGDTVFLRVWLIGGFGGVARWLEMLVVGVYAYETTGSAFLVALLVILRMAPLALFGSVIGTLADRVAPRRGLRVALACATLMSATVSLLFVLGWAHYWHVALASFGSGLVWTTDMPLRRRILGDVAGPERLAPAMSLDSATNNATRMLGPLIGGLLYQGLGTGGAFALSAGLYGVCVLLAFVVPVGGSSGAGQSAPTKVLRDFQEGFRYAWHDRDLLRVLLVTVVFNIWGFPFVSMIPVVGSDVLSLNAGWIGALAALEGAGALLGALVIAVHAKPRSFRPLYYFGTLAYLGFVFAVGAMTAVWPTAAMLFLVGLAGACFTTMQSTLVYSVAPPEMRGRLFGLLVICIGTGLIGFSNVGLMAEWFGASTAIRIIAAEGLIPLLLIGLGWRQLWGR